MVEELAAENGILSMVRSESGELIIDSHEPSSASSPFVHWSCRDAGERQRLRILESPTDWVNLGAGGVLAAPQEARGA